jgi:hypothetical protein
MMKMKWIVLAVALCASLSAGAAQQANHSLEVGKEFAYESRVEAPPIELEKTKPGQTVVMPKPLEQVIRVDGIEDCDGSPCLVLKAERLLPTMSHQAAGTQNRIHSQARVNRESGELVDIDTTFMVGSQTQTNRVKVKSRNSVFEDFYGPWMLDVREGWEASFELSGDRVRTYRVTGKETIAERPTFVVERVTPMPDGGTQVTTYWVDAEERFTVQVHEGDWTMTLKEARAEG